LRLDLKISYGITVHNESEELNNLLEILIHKTDVEDEIVICVDGEDEQVQEVITSWVQQYGHEDMKTIKVYHRKLDGDFASQKNSVIENCSGDYIMHIDADEYPHETLLQQLKQIIEMNDGVDLIYVPRVNTVDGITEHHIQKWGWRVNAPYEIYNEKVMDTESEEYKLLKKMDLIVDEKKI
jgi:glycosyltransferase involved in cell wall biosynthesis